LCNTLKKINAWPEINIDAEPAASIDADALSPVACPAAWLVSLTAIGIAAGGWIPVKTPWP